MAGVSNPDKKTTELAQALVTPASQTSSTILPRVCPCSLASCASWARSSGNVRVTTG